MAKDAKNIIFRPIQYDPTRRVYQGQAKGYNDNNQDYGYQGYQKQPSYEYKNTYADMTAICSQVSDASACKGNRMHMYNVGKGKSKHNAFIL